MQKINLPFFFQLGAGLNPLTRARTDQLWMSTLMFLASDARETIETTLRDVGQIKIARPEGEQLLKAIDKCFQWNVPNLNQVATGQELIDANELVIRAITFQTVLLAELQTLPTYQVDATGIYSLPDLIDRAEFMFPDSIRRKLSQKAIADVREAGRCLAFSRGTAAGFHMMRATELVLHMYYVGVCKPDPAPERLDNWGQYVTKLSKPAETETDVKKVVAIIDQIRERDRNLIMHPDVMLDDDEAFALFEVGKSAIMAMAPRLPDLDLLPAVAMLANPNATGVLT